MNAPFALAGLALALFSACVSTDLASQVAPEFRSHRFARVLVVADLGTLQARKTAEDRIVRELTDQRASALRSLDVLFAADTLPVEEFLNRAAEAGADAVLLLRVISEGAQGELSGPHYHATFDDEPGEDVVYGSTYYYGPRPAYAPWADYEAKLYETATGRVAWYATARTEGPSSSDARDFADSLAGAVVEQLLADQVLALERMR